MFVRPYRKHGIAPDILVLAYTNLPNGELTSSHQDQHESHKRVLELLLPSDTLTNWVEWLDKPDLVTSRSRQAMCRLLLKGLFVTSRSQTTVLSIHRKHHLQSRKQQVKQPTSTSTFTSTNTTSIHTVSNPNPSAPQNQANAAQDAKSVPTVDGTSSHLVPTNSHGMYVGLYACATKRFDTI
jgi:hypothetical protein